MMVRPLVLTRSIGFEDRAARPRRRPNFGMGDGPPDSHDKAASAFGPGNKAALQRFDQNLSPRSKRRAESEKIAAGQREQIDRAWKQSVGVWLVSVPIILVVICFLLGATGLIANVM